MAEVEIPPVQTEPEIPEEQLPEVEKPTEKSKVISVDFNPLNTKQTASLDTRELFYTTDTDAWIVLSVGDMNEPTGQYSLALINKEDGSIFQRAGDIVQGVAYYKLLPNEIKHAGRWVGQAVITLANGQTTASRFSFNVSGHILDGKDVREIVIQDFQTLMAQLNDLKDNSTNEFSFLKSEIEAFQTTIQENEDERQATELGRVAAEVMREENYESKLTAAIVEADVVEKVDNKVAELAPEIQQVTAQLAQKASEQDLIVERTRISSLMNLPEGSTTGDAQLADVAVGADGKVYSSAGDHVRAIAEGDAIKEGAIFENTLSDDLHDFINNGKINDYSVVLGNLDTVTSNASATQCYILNKPISKKGTIHSIGVKTFGEGIVYISLWEKNGSSFKLVDKVNFNAPLGKSFHEVNLPVKSIGLYIGVGGAVKYSTTGGSGFYDAGAVLTAQKGVVITPALSTLTTSSFGLEVEFGYESELLSVAKTSPVSLERLEDGTFDLIKNAWKGEKAIFDSGFNNINSVISAKTNVYVIKKSLPYSCITSINVFSTGGKVDLYIFDLVDGKYNVKKSFNFNTNLGENIFDIKYRIEEGQFLGVFGDIYYDGANSTQSIEFSDIPREVKLNEGTSYTAFASGVKVRFSVKINGILLNDTYPNGDSLTKTVEEISKPNFQQKDFYNNFQNTRTDWIYQNCTASNGLTLSGYSKAYLNKYLTFDRWTHRATVQLKDLSSVFGLVNNHTVKGAIYLVDALSNTINIYKQYTGGTTIPALKATVTIPFTLKLNRDYLLKVVKNGWKHVFSITDAQTLETATVEFDNSTVYPSENYAGKGWGGPGVVSFSGSVFVRNHNYSTENYPEVDALYIGDSITEGTNMGSNVSIDNRWCSQLRTSLNDGSAIISGRGGDTSGGVIDRLNSLYGLNIKSKIVVVLIGTNQQNAAGHADWKLEIVKIYDLIISKGSIPVICIPPMSANNQYILLMRDFILSKNWNTIRFDYATSLGRDGLTYDSSMFTDGVHPNLKGSNAMYTQALVDLKSLLW